MKKLTICFVSVSVLALMVSPSFAYDTAKSLGMAGANVAIADDLSAPYINPAGLAKSNERKAGLSISSKNVNWENDTFTAASSDSNLWENIGMVMPIGAGTIYAGSGTLRNFPFASDDIGADIKLTSKLYAPTVAYGTQISPLLAVGASASYLNEYEKLEWDNDVREETLSGIAFTLGALYAINPMVDIGISAFIPGGKSIVGEYDDGDKYSITGSSGEPSKMSIGGAIRPNENLTVGMQFDALGAFAFNVHRKYDDIDVVDGVSGDAVLATRIGMEYRIPVPASYVPIWAGVSFIPDNAAEVDPGDGPEDYYEMISNAKYATANTTNISIGTGYVGDTFDVGIALMSTTGVTKAGPEDTSITESKAVISGCFKI